MFFERIFRELHDHKIKYVVIGGVAVNLHGYPRMTGDLDIVISYEKTNVEKLIEVFKSLGFKPRVPVALEDFAEAAKRRAWFNEKGMKVFSVYNPKDPMEHVDIMIETHVDFGKVYKRKEIVSVGGMQLPVASIRDLIQLKKEAHRPKDEIDIRALKRIEELKDEKKKTR